MLIKNAYIRGIGNFDILITDGKFAKIDKNIPPDHHPIIDAKGGLVTPPFVEPHIHLDTTLTAGEPRYNQSGSLFEGIQIWSERKKLLTYEDVKQRAITTLKTLSRFGVQFVRTHIDITDPSLVALEAIIDLKKEVQDFIEIQVVAFPQEGILSFKNGKELLERAAKKNIDAIGIIPHFEFQRDWGVKSIEWALDLAQKYNYMVDAHCDEIDDEQSRFLEVLASESYIRGIGDKVTASHTTSMASYNNAYTYKLFNVLQKSQIHFVVNPLVNIHLGGRFDLYPKRRGFSRVKELVESGLNVCFGQDDIKDPWYPLGDGNPISGVKMGLHIGHMMGYDEINTSLDFVLNNASKALQLEKYGIQVGYPAHLLIFEHSTDYEIICENSPPLYSIRKGKILVQREAPSVIMGW